MLRNNASRPIGTHAFGFSANPVGKLRVCMRRKAGLRVMLKEVISKNYCVQDVNGAVVVDVCVSVPVRIM